MASSDFGAARKSPSRTPLPNTAMSNRLESLSKPSKPGLKFKPKAVKRKSEIERAKDAPSAPTVPTKPTRGAFRGRGRGGARGGRNRYEGTHVVSSGPLSAGSVSLGGSSSMNKLGLTGDQVYNNGSSEADAPQFLKADEPTEIDMTHADFDEPLFPVRAARDDSNSPEPEVPGSVSLDGDSDTTRSPSPVKSETPALETIQEKKKELESKLVQETEANASADEHSQMIADHQQILDMVTHADAPPFIMHLPALPTYSGSSGEIGQLRLHQSGKVTMALGNDIVVDVTRGADVDFLQQLAHLQLTETVEEDVDMVDGHGRPVRGKLVSVAPVRGKVIGTPQL
ncbi:DNA-directed RNA polymerase III subunit RPC4 [Diutina rugosa]